MLDIRYHGQMPNYSCFLKEAIEKIQIITGVSLLLIQSQIFLIWYFATDWNNGSNRIVSKPVLRRAEVALSKLLH